jgi:hypothetical protein
LASKEIPVSKVQRNGPNDATSTSSTTCAIRFDPGDRRTLIGGSDARIIMGDDEAELIRLWRDKRGKVGPKDLADNLVVQLGAVTEDLNRRWYQRNTGNAVKDVQKRIQHPVNKWMAATLDGLVDPGGAVFEAKFMLPSRSRRRKAYGAAAAQDNIVKWLIRSGAAALYFF